MANKTIKIKKVEKKLKTTKKSNELYDVIIDSIKELKGENIISLDFKNIKVAIFKYFIICEGNSNTHLKGIAEKIIKNIKEKLNIKYYSISETRGTGWILIDYNDIIIHLFLPEQRAYYDLENFWAEAKKIKH